MRVHVKSAQLAFGRGIYVFKSLELSSKCAATLIRMRATCKAMEHASPNMRVRMYPTRRGDSTAGVDGWGVCVGADALMRQVGGSCSEVLRVRGG